MSESHADDFTPCRRSRLDDADRLRRFHFQWPKITAALLASTTRWLMLGVIVAALIWLFGFSGAAKRRQKTDAERIEVEETVE